MKYVISGMCSAYACEYDPQNAVIQWFRLSQEEPTCVCIQPKTEEDGMALLKWAEENFDKLEVWAKEHKCPYRIEWLEEEISSQVRKGTCSMQWEYDQLYPFCMG